jgi:hypothetical protein
MRGPPIPQRIAPLQWRKPAFLWTPLALALAIGWPAAIFANDPPMQRLTLIAGVIVFALALTSLGASWALRRPPRTRRSVVLHVLTAGAAAAMGAPFVLTHLLGAVAAYEQSPAAGAFTLDMAAAMTPLALVLGLPVALISGTMFAIVALTRVRAPGELLDDGGLRPHDVQPFR